MSKYDLINESYGWQRASQHDLEAKLNGALSSHLPIRDQVRGICQTTFGGDLLTEPLANLLRVSLRELSATLNACGPN